jgi:hypothetical protein
MRFRVDSSIVRAHQTTSRMAGDQLITVRGRVVLAPKATPVIKVLRATRNVTLYGGCGAEGSRTLTGWNQTAAPSVTWENAAYGGRICWSRGMGGRMFAPKLAPNSVVPTCAHAGILPLAGRCQRPRGGHLQPAGGLPASTRLRGCPQTNAYHQALAANIRQGKPGWSGRTT